MPRSVAGAVVLAAAAVLASTGCVDGESGATASREYAYRLSLTEPLDTDCVDPSCREATYVVWVAPERGWVRSESVDETGFETTRIAAHGARVTSNGDGLPDIRVGPPSFLGEPPEIVAVDALRALGDVSVGDRVHVQLGWNRVELVVDRELPLEGREAQRLFAIPTRGTINRVLTPGTASNEVRAYWLGERFGERSAVAVVERVGLGEASYSVFYGRRAPRGPEEYGSSGQLQLVSTPLDDPAARRSSDGVQGASRTRVTLADGTRALLVTGSPGDSAYAVITPTTSIGFGGVSPADAKRVVASLRPVAP